MKTKFFGGLFLGLNIVLSAFLLSAVLSSPEAPQAVTTAPSQEAAPLTTEGFLGEVRLFAGTFAPRGWADCNGQIVSIAQNSALFSLLGTTYGGDGRATFALPDLQGRMPIGEGQGPGLPVYVLGSRGGVATFNTGNTVAGGSGVNIVSSSSAMPPYLSLRYIICVQGSFPSRS